MILSLLNKKFKKPKVVVRDSYMKLQPVDSVSAGQIVRQSQFVAFDFTEQNNFKSSDFSIANLQAVGASDMLRLMPSLSMSPLTMSDQFENVNYETSEKENA